RRRHRPRRDTDNSHLFPRHAALQTSVLAAPQTRQHAPVRPAMIQITKGKPTPDEIAALVALLSLAGATTPSGLIGSTAAGWRSTAPLAQLNPAELSRRDRRWRPWSA